MQSKINYLLVGLFVIILGSALLGAAAWLLFRGENKTYDLYRVYFNESVAGLNPKATVRYRGVQIGEVRSIRLDPKKPDQVDVVLAIERGTPIRRDTIATLSTRGLTGVASVELSGGAQGLPLEKAEDQDLPVIQAGPSLVTRLDDAFSSILTNVDHLSQRLERLLSDDNQTAITETLQHLNTISGTIAGRADSISKTLANLEALSATLASRAERFGRALDQAAKELENTSGLTNQMKATLQDAQSSVQSVRKAADSFQQTSRAFTGLAGAGQEALQRFNQNGMPELNTLLMQATDLLATWQRFAELLEQNPRSLLIGKPQGRPGPGEQ